MNSFVYFRCICFFYLVLSVLCQERCADEETEFLCRDGTCIDREFVCDGSKDCIDGEDETTDKCQFRPCSTSTGFSNRHDVDETSNRGGFGGINIPFLNIFSLNDPNYFVCKYGACISRSFACDGFSNCRDNSDESEEQCRHNTCGPVEFRCKYGGCIPLSYACNGVTSCHDGSDETFELCKNKRCNPTFQVKCAYGGCIRKNQLCNGVANCRDDSDESEEACGKGHTYRSLNPFATTPPTVITTTKSSLRVNPPASVNEEGCDAINIEGTSYEIPKCGGLNCDGDFLPVGTTIRARCKGGKVYRLTCNKNFVWISMENLGISMTKICSLEDISSATEISKDTGCSVVNFRSNFEVLKCGRGQFISDCNSKQFMPVGSILTQECDPSDTIVMFCNKNQQWQITSSTGQPGKPCQVDLARIKNECGRTKNLIGEAAGFSWSFLVGLFKKQEYICTGTLISYNIVLTSGHCLTRNKASSTDFIAPKDLTIQHYKRGRIVFTPISAIHIHPQYRGGNRPRFDAAIIKLTRFATSEDDFEPACLDSIGRFITKPAVVFNRTEGDSNFFWTEFSQSMDLSCFNRNTPCSRHLDIDKNQYCGINEGSDKFLHAGSSGGPYLIRVNGNKEETKWAVAGIVSHAVQTIKKNAEEIPCRKPHTVYASVFHLQKWITDCAFNDIC